MHNMIFDISGIKNLLLRDPNNYHTVGILEDEDICYVHLPCYP